MKRTRRRPFDRRGLIQLYAALLYNAHLKGFVSGEIYQGAFKALCVPGLNCYSCPAAVGACPLGALQNALSAANHRAPWYVLGILALFGVMLGRTVCGWLCPVGLIQDLLHKLPTFKIKKSRATRALSWLKYAVLAVFVVAAPLYYGLARGVPLPAFCKYICPAGTLEGGVALLANGNNAGLFAALGRLFTQKFVILVVVGTACVLCYRSFCRFLCPLGAIYGLFNRFAVTGARVDEGRCNGCGACVRACPMDIRRVGDRECIACGKCAGACAQGAISIRCGKLALVPDGQSEAPKPRRGRTAVRAVALAVLAAALVGFNLPKPNAGDAPVGYAVGERLADFTCDLVGGGQFHLADYRGRPVFINLWATYCGPCLEELPYFDAMRREHPETVVLAIHSGLATSPDEVAAFLTDKDWALDFAVDSEDMALYGLVNGSSKLPQTVVLNGRGEVVYNEIRSVTPDMLDGLLALAEGN